MDGVLNLGAEIVGMDKMWELVLHAEMWLLPRTSLGI